MRFADANGRAPGDGDGTLTRLADTAAGFLSAAADDVLGTSLSQYNPRAGTAGFQNGQFQGHVTMGLTGAGMAAYGGAEAVAGGQIVGGAAAAEVLSGGLATPGAAPAAAVGGVMVGQGLLTAGAGAWIAHNAQRNLQNTRVTDENGRVNASSNANKTSGNNQAAQTGKQAHKNFAAKLKSKGGVWDAEVTMKGANGKTYRVDGLTPGGDILELKPNTARGRSRGASQAKTYQRELGRKVRVVYY